MTSKPRRRHLRSSLAPAFATSLAVLACTASGIANGQTTTTAGPETKPEIASRGERKTVREIKYGEWQKVCFKTPGSNAVCRTTISGIWDTGQSALRADLIEREGEPNARLQLFLPVGLYLQAGVTLTIDQGKPHNIPYVWCMTNTCIAAEPADPQLIHDMENGTTLRLGVVDSSVQTVSTSLSLSKFAAVRKAPPSRTFEQDVDE